LGGGAAADSLPSFRLSAVDLMNDANQNTLMSPKPATAVAANAAKQQPKQGQTERRGIREVLIRQRVVLNMFEILKIRKHPCDIL
jgi:hypothetical protein